MVNGLDYRNFSIDPIEKVSNGGWYTSAGFDLSEVKKRWGIFNKRMTYTLDTATLLVTSNKISVNPAPDEISAESFSKRLIEQDFNPDAIKKFIGSKMSEASKKGSIDEVFKYLKNYFVIEDD